MVTENGQSEPQNLLDKAVGHINGMADPKAKRRYAEALAASLRFDESGHNPPQMKSPQGIENDFGIEVDELLDFNIVLKRKQIKDFARNYGKVLKASKVTMLFKVEAYEKYFQRPISRIGAKTKQSATVYAYAEVLQRCGVESQIALPDSVAALFKEVEIDFP